jgi:chromosome partitioning protein
MVTILLGSEKGGSGKTTIAMHLAVAAQRSTEAAVIVVDTDPQRTASRYARYRKGIPPLAYYKTPPEVPALLDAARNDGVAYAVVDTQGHSSADLCALMRLADLVIVPVRPTDADRGTIERTKAIVDAAGARAVAVLSQVPQGNSGSADAIATAAFLAEVGLEVIPIRIKFRRPYSEALANGKTVIENFAPGAVARDEMQTFFWHVKTLLDDQGTEGPRDSSPSVPA